MAIPIWSETNKLLGRFAVAGGVSTLFAFFSMPAIFYLCGRLSQIIYKNGAAEHQALIFNIAYVLSVILNVNFSFYLQKRAVFRSKKNWLGEYVKFWFGALGIIFIGYFIMWSLVEIYYINIIVANIITVCISAALSFTFHFLVTFK